MDSAFKFILMELVDMQATGTSTRRQVMDIWSTKMAVNTEVD